MSLQSFWLKRAINTPKSQLQIATVEHWLVTKYRRYSNDVYLTIILDGPTPFEPACSITRIELPGGSRIEWLEWKDGRGLLFQCADCARLWRIYTTGLVLEVATKK